MSIRNIQIRKQKILPLLLAGGLTLSLSACGNNTIMDDVSIEALMAQEEVNNLTLLDELSVDQYNDVLDNGEKLERYIYLLKELKNYDLTGVENLRPLPDEEYKKLENLSLEEYVEIFNDADSIDINFVALEKRLDAIKKLHYLKNYCQSWVDANGVDVALDLMINSVKANAAVELRIPVEDYNYISIKERPSINEPNLKYVIIINDTEYEVKADDHGLWDTIDYIYKLQNPNLMTNEEKEKFENDQFYRYEKAIDLSKITICSGSNLKDGNILEVQNSSDYIRKFIV